MDPVLNKGNLDRIYRIYWIIDRLRRGKDNWDTDPPAAKKNYKDFRDILKIYSLRSMKENMEGVDEGSHRNY